MTNAGMPGALAITGALWRRAPLWRFAVMAALLASLLFLLFPPRRSTLPTPPPTAKQPFTTDPPTYVPRVPRAPSPAVPPVLAQKTPAVAGNSTMASSSTLTRPNPAAPRNAVINMAPAAGAAANDAAAHDESDLNPAQLGQLYRGSVMIEGFSVPLPAGDWANLANSSITLPAATGHAHFLGRIRHRRLIGGIRIFAVRSNDSPGAGFNEVKSCTELNPARNYVAIDGDMTPNGHQACWTIRNVYATPWLRWADHNVKMQSIDRAAAGDMTANGVTFPQDFMSVTFTRTETWGLLEVMYLFSPEAQGISSNTVLAVGESDWTATNVGRYPEKAAYVATLKAWGIEFWPRFKDAFDAGHPR